MLARRNQAKAAVALPLYAGCMSRVVQIADAPGGVFVHVTEVLSALEPEATELEWAVLDLREALEASGLDVVAVQAQVEQAPTGLHLTFHELQRLAAGLQQVVDGLFVGCADASGFPSRTASDDVIIERAAIAVAAFDSSFWLVSGPDEVLDRVHTQFERVREQDASAVNLSAWDR
jgi:hypothetical protein